MAGKRSTPSYMCPVCDESFARLDKGSCPHCNTKLIRKKLPSQGTNRTLNYTYVIADHAAKPIIRKEEEAKEVGLTWIVKNENLDMVAKKNLETEEWLVQFKTTQMGYIYCPSCLDKMFKNITLSGEANHKCKKCKSIITFVF